MADAAGAELEMPGAGYDFFDVTNIFIQAGQGMESRSGLNVMILTSFLFRP
jgi:hypothetical protein